MVILNNFIDFDPFENFHATILDTYWIFNNDQAFPKLVKEKKEPSGPQDNSQWTLYFDGVKCKISSGANVWMVSLTGSKTLKNFHFQFSYSKNNINYEGLVHSLVLTEWIGMKTIQVFKDSKLFISKFYRQEATKM